MRPEVAMPLLKNSSRTGRGTPLKAAAALIAFMVFMTLPIANSSQAQPDREIQGEANDYRGRTLLGVMSQWGMKDEEEPTDCWYTTTEDIDSVVDGSVPGTKAVTYDLDRSEYKNWSCLPAEVQGQMRNAEVDVDLRAYAFEEMKYSRSGEPEVEPVGGVEIPDGEPAEFEKKEQDPDFDYPDGFNPQRKYLRMFNTLAANGIQSVMAHLEKAVPRWRKDEPLNPYWYYDKNPPEWADGYWFTKGKERPEDPNPSNWDLNKGIIMPNAIYQPLSLAFVRLVAGHLAANYGGQIGYYELAEEPGYDLRLLMDGYNIPDGFETMPLADRIADSHFNYEGKPVYLTGWSVTDYLKVQQALYSIIKANDPGANSYVFSGSLCDPSGEFDNPLYGDLDQWGNPRAPGRYHWDTYNRVLDDVGRPGQDLSVKVDSSSPVFCERPMYFNYNEAMPGGHTQLGARKPTKEWYFAEGATYDKSTSPNTFEEYITIQNPQPEQANVTITYMLGEGAPIVKTFQVKAKSRMTVSVNSESEGVGKNKDVSAYVRSDRDVVCERPMYSDYTSSQGWKSSGGDVVLGVNEPRHYWFFAEGCTRPGFQEFLCLQNPNDSPAEVKITYMTNGWGKKEMDSLTVPEKSRVTVDVNREVTAAIGRNQDVSAWVYSSPPIVVERSMYFNYKGPNDRRCTGTHVVTGAAEPAKEWNFAEGCTRQNVGDRQWYDTWLSIQNPIDLPAEVTVSYLLENEPQKNIPVTVPPNSRQTIYVNGAVEGVGLEEDVGMSVTSNLPIVCERPMYFSQSRMYRAMIRRDSLENMGIDPDQEMTRGEPIVIWKDAKDNRGIPVDWRRVPGKPGICTDFTQERKRNIMRAAGKDYTPTPEEEHYITRDDYRWAYLREAVDGGHCVVGDSQKPSTEWYFAEGRVGTTFDAYSSKDCSGACFEEFICISNPGDTDAYVRLTFQPSGGVEFAGSGDRSDNSANWHYTRTYTIPAHRRRTININRETGFSKTCDAAGVHILIDPDPLHAEHPENRQGAVVDGVDDGHADRNDSEGKSDQSGRNTTSERSTCGTYIQLYNLINKVFARQNEQLGNMELAVTSMGWPHRVDDMQTGETFKEMVRPWGTDYTWEGQTYFVRAIASLLETTPCRKIWLYKDQDELEPWDHQYHGLFPFWYAGEGGKESWNAWDDRGGLNDDFMDDYGWGGYGRIGVSEIINSLPGSPPINPPRSSVPSGPFP